MKLPVFEVATTVAPADRLPEMGRQIFPKDDFKMVEKGTKVELQSPVGTAEVDIGNGGVWASDTTSLWRFNPAAGTKRNLILPKRAEAVAIDHLKKFAILPDIEKPFRLKPARTTGAMTAFTTADNAPGRRFRKILPYCTT